jgi:hypothetical protein
MNFYFYFFVGVQILADAEHPGNQILGGIHQQCEEDDHKLPTKETHFKVI